MYCETELRFQESPTHPCSNRVSCRLVPLLSINISAVTMSNSPLDIVLVLVLLFRLVISQVKGYAS